MTLPIEDEALVARKRALRSVVLARRDAMSAEARAQASQAMMDKVMALDEWRAARTVLSYVSFGSEVHTLDFFSAVRAQGKTAVLPRVDALEHSLTLHRVDDLSELAAGVWGIREPRADAPIVALADIDFVLVPGVAFDALGHRMGYGAGYYDKLLAAAPAKPLRVAAAFDCQVVEEVPSGPRDQQVHLLFTESRQWRIS